MNPPLRRSSRRVLLLLAVAVFFGCSPKERKLVGVWQMNAPGPYTIYYTFHSNHTYTVTTSNSMLGGIDGTWELHNGMLRMKMDYSAIFSNSIPSLQPYKERVNVSKITDSTMEWETMSLDSGKMTFKRLVSYNAGNTKP